MLDEFDLHVVAEEILGTYYSEQSKDLVITLLLLDLAPYRDIEI